MVLGRFEIIPMDGNGVITMTLALFSLILNFFSFYVGIEFVYFLRRLSNMAEKLEYNQSLPSSTKGFQELVYDSAWLTIFFFIISFLYTCALGISLVGWYLDRSKIMGVVLDLNVMKYKNNLIICMVVLVCIQGLLTALVDSVFLQNVLEQNTSEMEDEVFEAISIYAG